MNHIHQKAIELKYEGKSYKEISKKLGSKFTEGTLKQYFSRDGRLYVPYLEYSFEVNNQRIEECTNVLRRSVVEASQALVEGLKRAVKSENDALAIKYATTILDRVGVTGDKSGEQKSYIEAETYEEFVDNCKLANIDPDTGLRIDVRE